MKFIILITTFFFILLSCRDTKFKKQKIGNNIVEATFINDSVMDGVAKYYDSTGILESQFTFVKGIKSGKATTFYTNGRIKDSMNYSDNLLNGPGAKYDRNGLLLFRLTYYYGLKFGDQSFYRNGFVNNYDFYNLEQKQLVYCKYDTSGSCDSLIFNARPIVTYGLIEKQNPAIRLLLYFPHPPDFTVIYELGLIDTLQNKQNKIMLNSDRLLLDTSLTIPNKDLRYYISVDYKSISNDSTVNVLFQKL